MKRTGRAVSALLVLSLVSGLLPARAWASVAGSGSASAGVSAGAAIADFTTTVGDVVGSAVASASDAAGQSVGASESGAASEDAIAPAALDDDSAELQGLIDAADSDVTITVSRDMVLDETVVVPAGKRVTLVDDGTARTLSGAAEPLFRVEGALVVDATSDDALVLRGTAHDTPEQGTAVTVTGTLELRSGTVCVGGAKAAFEAGVFVGSGGSLEMSGGIVTGAETVAESRLGTAAVVVAHGGSLALSGGTIEGNRCASGETVLVADGSSMTMTGGTITDNPIGLHITGHSTLSLEGGSICGNSVQGIIVNDGANMTMSGGSVSRNGSSGSGAGGGMRLSNVGTVTISGGTISQNAARFGGGIYVSGSADGVSLVRCDITDNVSDGYGGGIYVESGTTGLVLTNAYVVSNSATDAGGGLWCCPSSDTTIDTSEGLALFDNEAGKAGDDLACVARAGSEASLSLSGRMLGGYEMSLYQDGSISYDGSTGASVVDGCVYGALPRYDATDPGEPVRVDGSGRCQAVKSVVTDAARRNSRSLASLVITGNAARVGGGIATNGSLSFGQTDEWSLEVEKEWSDDVDRSLVKPVSVYLVIGGTVCGQATLSEESGWTARFEGLPDPATLGNLSIEVVEGRLDGDSVVQTQEFDVDYAYERDADARAIHVTVTNSAPPEGDVARPKGGDSSLPKTGDDTWPAARAAFIALSAAALGLGLRARRGHGRERA